MTDFGRRSGDMFKSTYDADEDGTVDDSEKLEDNTLAQVQDHTPKTHTHIESDVTDLDHDALKIKGIPVDNAAIGDGKRLTYQVISGHIEYQTPDPAGPANAIRGDAQANRYFRTSQLLVEDGTDADTLKCTLANRWNGDTIPVQDNIAKDATTGHFYLNPAGTQLTILNTGLTGSALYANQGGYYNTTGYVLCAITARSASGILIYTYNILTGDPIDMTLQIQLGLFTLELLYIASAPPL